jgi:hypothetical protein
VLDGGSRRTRDVVYSAHWFNPKKFKIQNSKFKIQNSKFKIQNSKFKIQNSKFKIQNSKFKIQNSSMHLMGGVSTFWVPWIGVVVVTCIHKHTDLQSIFDRDQPSK